MNIKSLLIVEIDGVGIFDYPDFVNAYISYAEDKSGNVLTDEQLSQLTEDNQEFIQELAHEEMFWGA